jgi:hypothetical protein
MSSIKVTGIVPAMGFRQDGVVARIYRMRGSPDYLMLLLECGKLENIFLRF